ncbi:hypothetical protein [Massilia genomosp. 1]|uniref:J domain-containing protein n=1 Tax=Massilia genomosp. 1 TaxID=2609280 RepID=A0ABX0ML77_9BURK|nr:hypothetical protein [Massilia genomosp. 1]NHZ63101.1 hypothetical protein [Massilia genomosp. 1]
MNIWSVLGMTASRDERAIKRAYAARLKVTRPEDDPVAFQILNDAYQAALQLARQANDLDWPDEQPAPPETRQGQDDREQPVYVAAYEFDPDAPPAPAPPREEAPVYVAAYEFDPDAPVYSACYEVDPSAPPPEAPAPAPAFEPPAPAQPPEPPRPRPKPEQYRLPEILPAPLPGTGPETTIMQARRVWAAFLTRAHSKPREHLAQLFAGEELLNIDVRDHFEECAVQYCAGEGCEDDFREAMAGHFNWVDDAGFVGRQMPDETGMMLARLRAQRSYQHFCQLALEDEVVRALLDGDPRGVIGRYPDAAFTERMRELLEHVHCYHGEMLDLKLDAGIVEHWVAVVRGRGWSA